MDKYEYLWMNVRNNMLPADISVGRQRQYGYDEIFNMGIEAMMENLYLSEKQAQYIMSTRMRLDENDIYDAFLKSDIKVTTVHDDSYPKRLLNIDNRPYALFYYGDLPEDNKKSVAIIGARNCSEYGREMAQIIASGLGKEKINVISGMAYGIDGISQMGAMESGGKSFGIVGNGVDICYPRSNKPLYNRLKCNGGVISEYPLGASARPDNFPMRNRIISGLSDIVIVIEARLKSGTFITVDYALSQGKEIMVLPGRATDPLSVGCNALLSQGAHVVQCAEDVLRLLDTMSDDFYSVKKEPKNYNKNELLNSVPKEKEKILLEREENMVYSVLDFYALSPEDIAKLLKMDIFKVMSILICLEMKGIIKEKGKNLYVKCR